MSAYPLRVENLLWRTLPKGGLWAAHARDWQSDELHPLERKEAQALMEEINATLALQGSAGASLRVMGDSAAICVPPHLIERFTEEYQGVAIMENAPRSQGIGLF